MMLQLRLLLGTFGSFCGLFSYSQEIKQFQHDHPQVAFISNERFQYFTKEEITLLKGNFILFDTTIESADLTNFQSKPEEKSNEDLSENTTEMSLEQRNEVKIWKATHPQVKIVKRSEFDQLQVLDQQVYLASQCMILIGESITFDDILNYPY